MKRQRQTSAGCSSPGHQPTASTWVCLDATGAPVTVTNSALTLALAQHVTCTITNDDQPSTLVLDKILTNDNGGLTIPEMLRPYMGGQERILPRSVK